MSYSVYIAVTAIVHCLGGLVSEEKLRELIYETRILAKKVAGQSNWISPQ